MFDYLNIRVYDDEKTDLLKHWDNTFKYISKAKNQGSKVLVHCKMGVSRSASVVIAYAMKAYSWDLKKALTYVQTKRQCIKPNSSFIAQLETYQVSCLGLCIYLYFANLLITIFVPHDDAERKIWRPNIIFHRKCRKQKINR